MKEETKKYGFILDEIKAEDYVLGGFEFAYGFPLQGDGQWDAFLPVFEAQKQGSLETWNCTAYGTLNAIEILMKRKFNVEENYSERYLGIAAGTKPPGNSPNKVAETLRKVSGVVNDRLLPFDVGVRTIRDYYSPDPLPSELLAIGRDWLREYLFK